MAVGTEFGTVHDDDYSVQTDALPVIGDAEKPNPNNRVLIGNKSYDTELTPEEETKFADWKRQYAPNDSGADYDLRGAYKEGITPDSERGHLPDTYKKPNHITFSQESQYDADKQGGIWSKDTDGKSVFTPGPTNLSNFSPDELKDYFSKYEPESRLNLPEKDYEGDLFRNFWNRATGSNGVTREQTWPEKMAAGLVHGLMFPGDAQAGKFIQQPTTPGLWSDEDEAMQQIYDKEATGRAAELAGALVFGPAPVAAKVAEGTLGSFAGVGARTLDVQKLFMARKLEAQGVHPDNIWQETGMFRGIDNKWRWELPSHEMKLKELPKDGEAVPLDSVIHYPSLFEAYPGLKNMEFVDNPNLGSLGEFNPQTGRISINSKELLKYNENFESTILHEVQHAIQQWEGFKFKGSNPAHAYQTALDKLEHKMDTLIADGKISTPEFREALQLHDDLGQARHGISQVLYRGNPGEVEARLAELRRAMGPRSKAVETPEQTYKRAQIVYGKESMPDPLPNTHTRYLDEPFTESAAHSEPTQLRRAANDNEKPMDTKSLSDALNDHFKETVQAPHEEFLKKYDELHGFMENTLTKKGGWTELNVARYNKMGRELNQEWEDVPFKSKTDKLIEELKAKSDKDLK